MDVAVVGVFVQREVEQADRVDVLQSGVPRALRGLLAYGEGGVVDAAVLEIGLLCLLHLHDEAPAVARHAVHVEHCAPVAVAVAQLLAVEVLHVGYVQVLGCEQRVEEADEQVLVHLCAEQPLETEVGVGVDETLVS